MNSILNMPSPNDAELTARALAGQRDAFAQIVTRYQSLVCSLVYSATVFKSLRKRIRFEEGPFRNTHDPDLFFGSPESKGYAWTVYGWLILVTLCNPFAALTIYAAKAQDPVAFFIMLIILAATLLISRRTVVLKPGRAVLVGCVIMISQFPLLLAALLLRWEKWTGQSPWRIAGYDLILPAVGLFLFTFAIAHWLLKRKNNLKN